MKNFEKIYWWFVIVLISVVCISEYNDLVSERLTYSKYNKLQEIRQDESIEEEKEVRDECEPD